MSKALRTSLIVIGVVVASAALILVGMVFARMNWASPWGWHGFVSPEFNTETSDAIPYSYGGMMGISAPEGDELAPLGFMDPSMMSGYGMLARAGMMSGYAMMGSSGMMGASSMMGVFSNSSLLGIEPIALADAEAAIKDYLNIIHRDNLDIGEIMVFDNHAYAQIVEVDTGIGALELLVDPVTLAVSPEPGPNMMWNLKYGHMSSASGFGMMGGFNSQLSEDMVEMMDETLRDDISTEMPLEAEEAVEVAQRYLEAYIPGTEADEHADPFYGYYTLHVLRDGTTVGMLSVNGYTRQVFLHTWHGDLIAMNEEN